MKQLKKIGRFFCSMKFALILLMILVVACTAGSLIQQKQAESYYIEQFSEQGARAIMLFGLNDVFHSLWFIILTVLLCINLVLCNLVHFPTLIRRMKEGYSLEKCLKAWDKEPIVVVKDAKPLFHQLGFRKTQEVQDAEGNTYLYAVKNKVGIWGAWLCHLGILIIIIGFSFGQMMQKEYTVYGVPGQTREVGDTGYELTIDDFEIKLREDDTVEQYQATVTMKDTKTGETQSGQTEVNHPLSMFGMKCYQNSTGWAANVEIWHDGVKEQEQLLCVGEYALVESMEGLAVVFSAFYPDYVKGENGGMTQSSKLNNPAYLYRLYFHDQVLGMNVLMGDERITIDNYDILFKDPQPYTLLQVKRDPFSWLTGIGGLVVLIALILAFYLRPAEIWAKLQEDGTYAVAGRSRKGGQLFIDKLKETGEAIADK